MGVRVTVKKKGPGIDAVFRKMRAISSLTLTVGVQGARAAKPVGRKEIRGGFLNLDQETGELTEHIVTLRAGTNMASVAFFNEFGTRNIPQRSFLRGGIFEARADIAEEIAKAMARYLVQPKADAVTALATVGRLAASKVRTRINTTSHWARPNAPSTVKAKGFDRPLHNTDSLSKSLSWAVRGPGGSIISEGPAR